MSAIDRAFTEKVERILGTPETIELSPTGRTLLRYADFTVSREGRLAVAGKIVNGYSRFAVVAKDGELRWRKERPEPSTGDALRRSRTSSNDRAKPDAVRKSAL